MISSPGCAGRQCSAIAPRRAAVEQRVVEAVGRERLAAPRAARLVVAHRDPDVGVERVGAVGRHRRVVGELRAVGLGELVARRARRPAPRGPRACRGSRASARRCCRRRRRRARGPRRSPNASRSVIRSASAWHGWWPRREHVDDGHRRVGGELAQALLAARAQADRRGVAGEHERGVAHRLAARELQLVGAQHHRVAAQLDDAGLHRRARARRGVLEQQRDRAVLEHARGGGLGLELERAVEQAVELRGGELLAGEEVARQVRTVPSAHAARAPRSPLLLLLVLAAGCGEEKASAGSGSAGGTATEPPPRRRRHRAGGDEGHPLRPREGHRARRADRALDQRGRRRAHRQGREGRRLRVQDALQGRDLRGEADQGRHDRLRLHDPPEPARARSPSSRSS